MATVSPIRLTLREAREKAGLTQVELATKAKVRQATISDMETGKRGRVDLEVLDKLCAVLKVQPGELMVWERKRGRP